MVYITWLCNTQEIWGERRHYILNYLILQASQTYCIIFFKILLIRFKHHFDCFPLKATKLAQDTFLISFKFDSFCNKFNQDSLATIINKYIINYTHNLWNTSFLLVELEILLACKSHKGLRIFIPLITHENVWVYMHQEKTTEILTTH